MVADEGVELVVRSAPSAPGLDLAPAHRARTPPARRSRASSRTQARKSRPVGLVVHVVEADRRRRRRVARREPHRPARRRPHRPDMRLEAVPAHRRLAVVAHRERQEMKLDVGIFDPGPRAHEGRRSRTGSTRRARAGDSSHCAPISALRQQVVVAIERDRLRARLLDVDLEMVLQVAADARAGRRRPRCRARPDARAGADPRQHQQLRRVDRGRRQDHLAPRRDDLAPPPRAISTPVARPSRSTTRSARQRSTVHVEPRAAPGAGRRWPPTSAGPARSSPPSARSLPASRRCSRRSRSIARLPPRLDEGVGAAGCRAARA